MKNFTNFVAIGYVVAFDHDVILLDNRMRIDVPIEVAVPLYHEVKVGDQVIIQGTCSGTYSSIRDSYENIFTAETVGLIK